MKAVFYGHGTLRLDTAAGQSVFIDPHFPGDYSVPADFILVTHRHFDHVGALDRVIRAPGCVEIMPEDAVKDGKYLEMEKSGVKITAVEASNANHDPRCCVGYIIEADGIRVYCAGDTSKTADMEKMGDIAWAFLPIDGIYNMGPEEASECARIIAPGVAFPIHNDPRSNSDFTFYPTGFDRFDYPSTVVLRPGESFPL